MILIHIHFLCVINNLTLQLSYHLAQRLRPRLCLVRLLVSVSLNLAIVCTASVSNVYSCPPAAPAWCDNCFPMLSPAWHLHRCHGLDSAVVLAHQGNSAALTRIPTSSVNTFSPSKFSSLPSLLQFIRIPWAMFVSPRENQFALCSTS